MTSSAQAAKLTSQCGSTSDGTWHLCWDDSAFAVKALDLVQEMVDDLGMLLLACTGPRRFRPREERPAEVEGGRPYATARKAKASVPSHLILYGSTWLSQELLVGVK